MKKRVAKLIFSFVFCIVLAAGFSVSAFADPFAGAVAGSIGAMGATIGSTGANVGAFSNYMTGATSSDPLGDWTDPLGDYQVYYKHDAYTETVEGVTTTYDLVWYSHDFATKFQDEGIAFLNDNQIGSDSSGILATGSGFVGDIPIFTVGSTLTSQRFGLNAGTSILGPFTVNITEIPNPPAGQIYIDLQINAQGTSRKSAAASSVNGYAGQITVPANTNNATMRAGFDNVNGQINPYSSLTMTNQFTADTFNFNYVSATVDKDAIGPLQGFQMFIPSGTIQGVTDGYYTVDGGSGSDTILDIQDAVTQSAFEGSFTKPSWEESPDIPVPPVPPTPVPSDTPLGEVPYEDFLDTFGQSIYDKLDDAADAVDTAGQSIVDELEETQSVIDTVGQAIESAIEAVEAKIDSLADTVEAVLEAILTHPLDLFDAFLDGLPNIPVLSDLFDNIKRHVGIWHYVVEWMGCIIGFLTFFIGLFADVAYCMVVPIYACVAAAICLAFYKRFGR